MAPAMNSQTTCATGSNGDENQAGPRDAGELKVPTGEVMAFLAERPDLTALREAYPQLSPEDLKRAFARAGSALQGVRSVYREKYINGAELPRSTGLPEPDGSLHKGNVFRALVAPLKPGKMLDLGTGKGNHALSAAQMGWDVTAVDARAERWPDPEAEQDPAVASLIRAINWVQADVREYPIGRKEFDCICILGTLHHLELDDQIALISRCAGTLLMLDTRLAAAAVDRQGDYEGAIIQEHGESSEERDEIPTAAWGNATSFRHTEESLVRLIRAAGYPQVMMMRPPHRRDYTFYLCLPRDKSDNREAGSIRAKNKKSVGRGRGTGLWSHYAGDQPQD